MFLVYLGYFIFGEIFKMNYKIELSPKEIPEYIKFLKDQIKKNSDIIKSKSEENNILKLRLNKLSKGLSITLNTSDKIAFKIKSEVVNYPAGYLPNMLWLEKIKYILQKSSNGLTTSQIVEQLIKIEPKYNASKQTAVRSISATVSAKSKKDGELQRVTNFRNEYVYTIKKKKVKQLSKIKNKSTDEEIPF